MALNSCFLAFVLSANVCTAAAGPAPKPLTIAKAEARNEAAAPSFSAQTHEAELIAEFLTDALRLSYAQQCAVQAHVLAQHKALRLAATTADVVQAQRTYRTALRRVLLVSQLDAYNSLSLRLK